MINKLILVILPFLLIGCKSTKIQDSIGSREDKFTAAYYNKYTNSYEWDQWDYYIDAIKKGKIIFNYPTAIIIYLISNVKILDSHPEENELDPINKLGIHVIIFRWSW